MLVIHALNVNSVELEGSQLLLGHLAIAGVVRASVFAFNHLTHLQHRTNMGAVWSRIMSHLAAHQANDAADADDAPQVEAAPAADGGGQSTDDDNAIDPVTGLSRRQKDYVQQSWQLVRKDLRAAGLGFFSA